MNIFVDFDMTLTEHHSHRYLTEKLKIPHTMNSFHEGVLAVYAPTEKTFKTNGTTAVTIIKTEYVADFLQKSKTKPKDSIFIDDTNVNVKEMKRKFPDMECIEASPGDYERNVSQIEYWIKSKLSRVDLGGRRKKTKSRYLNIMRKSRYSKKK